MLSNFLYLLCLNLLDSGKYDIIKERRERMTDAILALYKRAGVKPREICYPVLSDGQQLDLLKVLIEGRWIEFAHYRKGDLGSSCYYAGKVDFKAHLEAEEFEEVLAGLIVRLWSNLSPTDQNKIKEILKNGN